MTKIKEIIEKTNGFCIEGGFFYAALTDCVIFLNWPLDTSFENMAVSEKLLECRIFSERGELRIWRSTIEDGFRYRWLAENGSLGYYDEWQFLDIDAQTVKKSSESEKLYDVRTTGGGAYTIPAVYADQNDVVSEMIKNYASDHKNDINIQVGVRYHLSYYDRTGQAYIKDWRLCGLKRGDERNG